MKAGMWIRIGSAGMLVAALAGCGGGNSPPPTFTVGGAVSGSVGSVVLQNNGAGNLTVNANGTFGFTGPLNRGAAYNVTVLTSPVLQACSVANGSGTVSANITNVAVTCANAPPTLVLTLEKTKLFRFAWNSVAGSTHYRLQEDPTGSSGFTQLGADIPAPTTSLDEVATLYRRLNARYIVQACAGSRCIDSNTVNVTRTLAEAIGYFKASNPQRGATFGISVALSTDGKTLAVGATGERSLATGIDGDQSDVGADTAGAVYVFTRTGNVWAQQAYVKASNTDAGDLFGISVALSADGSILAVGAIGERSNATRVQNDQFNNDLPDAGAVYSFSRVGTTWSQQAYIKASNTQALDLFGGQVALSGDGRTLAVGAMGEDGDDSGSQQQSGAVYVFERPVDTDPWAQRAYLKASNILGFSNFGAALALSTDGKTLAVGADRAEISGTVYVFGRSGVLWQQQAALKPSTADADDAFGSAVALSEDGNTLAVGAIGEDGSGGAAGEDDDQNADSGAVYVFARSTNNVWGAHEAYIKASNAGENDQLGGSVALSADGQTLVVSARREASTARGIGGDETDNSVEFAGAAYAFTRSGASWTQQAYIKASNTSRSDFFGSVALSGDATILAVGALAEHSKSAGINSDESDVSLLAAGAVYVY